MKLDVVVDVAAAIGQVASALFAIPVAVIAYFAWRTSVNSAKATERLTEIERVRLHAELRPQFQVEAAIGRTGVVILKLTLIGPPALPRLDSVSAVIRTTRNIESASAFFDPNDPRDDEAYRFSANEDVWPGRTPDRTEKFRMTLGDTEYLNMAPLWRELGGELPSRPIRTALVCEVAGFEGWVVPITVSVPRGMKISKAKVTRSRPAP